MNNAAETRTVVIERFMPHPAEKVWRALTQQPLIEEWLMKNDFEPVKGRHFSLHTQPQPGWDGRIDCEVLAAEPHRLLTYTWNASVPGVSDDLRTVVTFTLDPTDGGVNLRMEQSGFRPSEERAYQGAQYGWQHFFGKLETTLGKIA
ncbi:SRPBCC family protein [Massilia endophytica]|uniref:SRPBCC family protein n=1 Tax=Massilia endophytica TaxID=2899220 RepID=UPI001E3E3E19|nr:SRPBCC domain-containing protein [Massilia endophytica]UGQ45513.1 SRPBCC domain-containing protein [Massilia endophytica]